MPTKNLMISLVLVLSSFQANATLVELNSGLFAFTTGAAGSGRGIGFEAETDFSISSIGIFGDLDSQSFDVQIYSSTDGHQATGLLASSTAVLGGVGNGWHDIGINFSFDDNSFYVLNWQPTVSNTTWANTLDYYRDSALPVTIAGLATLIDGVSGFGATEFLNIVHPNLRINTVAAVVPIPAAIWLFGTALIGLVGFSKRWKAA